MLSDATWLGILIVATALSPMIMAWLVNRNNNKTARTAANAAVLTAEMAARVLSVANARVAERDRVTNDKLDSVHALVNSDKTEGMQREFDALRGQLALMLEIVELKKLGGHGPSAETLAAITAVNVRLVDLGETLKNRTNL